jgi:SAM-dependent methyltransferase
MKQSMPPPDFDRIARLYRWAEYLSLGPLLQRTRTHFLPQLTHCRCALVLGDGDGRFTARLLEQANGIRVLAIDTSAAMLGLLRKRCRGSADRLRTLQASALTITPPPDTDLIVTHFFLDCLTQTELDTLTASISASIRPGTLWLLSDFGQPAPRILRPFAELYIRSLYLAFRLLTGLRVTHLPDPQTSLRSAGFNRIARNEILLGLIYTEIWQRT